MADGVPDQGVGGVDAVTQLASLFEQQNAKQGEIFQQHLNVLTAMAQKIQMGDAGPVNFQANTAMAGMTTAATLATSQAGAAIPGSRGAVSLEPPPGQATAASLAAQRQAQGAPVGGQPTPGQGNPLAGQTTAATTVGAGGGSGGGGAGGTGGGSPPGSAPGDGGGYHGGGGSGGGIGGYAPAVPATAGGLADSAFAGAQGMLNKVPVVGSMINKGINLGMKFATEWRDQRNKNLWYRAYGGDTSAGQEFADRIAEEKARVQHFGMFDEAESRQAFKQTTAMGYSQNAQGSRYSRDDIIGLMAQAKGDTGMSVGESAQAFDMMGRNGNTGLQQLIEQIKTLQDEAGKAGVNVKQATQSLMAYGQADMSVFGSAGMNIAQSDQAAQTSWGKNFQDLNMSQRYQNPQYMYAMAGMNNMSMSQMESLATTNKAQFDVKTGSVTKEKVAQWLQSADPGAYRALMAEIQRSKADLSGPAAGDRAQQIAEDWWATHASRAIDPMAFVSLVNLWSGQKFSPMDRVGALKFFIINYYSALGTLAQGQKALNSSGQINASGQVATGKSAGMQAGQTTAALFSSLGGSHLTSAEAAFKAETDSKGGTYSGAMANTLKFFQQHGGSDDQLVRVEAKGGYRVMKMSEAIKGGFESQITSGRAQMVGGTNAGKTIADLGIGADTSKKNLRQARASERRQTAAGQSYTAYHKAHPDAMTGAKAGTPNKVTFDLTDEAKKLLKPLREHAEDAMGIPRRDLVTPMRDFFSHPSVGGGLKLAASGPKAILDAENTAGSLVVDEAGAVGSAGKDVADFLNPWG